MADGTFLLAPPEVIDNIDDPASCTGIPGVHYVLRPEQGAMLLQLAKANPLRDISVINGDDVWIIRGAMLKGFLTALAESHEG